MAFEINSDSIKLQQLEIFNFKSISGSMILNSFQQFNSIVGPNGCGKSNLMDALAFVMGEKSQKLRVHKLTDLIHGASINKPVTDRVYVSATFQINKQVLVQFRREIKANSTEYTFKADENEPEMVVTRDEYVALLKKYNMNVELNHMIIYQGDIEYFSCQSPKQLMKYFEELCGSELRDSFNSLDEKQSEMDNIVRRGMDRKVIIENQLKEEAKNKKILDDYNNAKEKYEEAQTIYTLFQLFCANKEIFRLDGLMEEENGEFQELNAKIKELQEEIVENKKQKTILNITMAVNEKKLKDLNDLSRQESLLLTQMEEAVVHFSTKIKNNEENRENEEKKLRESNEEVELLRKQLTEANRVEESQEGLSEIISDENTSQRYFELKNHAVKSSSVAYNNENDPIDRKLRSLQDELDLFVFRRNPIQAKLANSRQLLAEWNNRVLALEKAEMENKLIVDRLNKNRQNMQSCQQSIVKLSERLAEIDDFMEEHSINQKNEEKEKVLKKLMEKYPDQVYGRFADLCQPVHPKYQAALTKVIGRFMEAIVCDSYLTAQGCIKFLRAEQLTRETFLPLDSIKTITAKKITSSMSTDKHGNKVIVLLENTLRFDKKYEAAVSNVCKGTYLVEGNRDDLVDYLYTSRVNVVNINGTFYQRSGLISGGLVNLSRQAQRWNQKKFDKLRTEKNGLKDDLVKVQTLLLRETKREQDEKSGNSVQEQESRISYIRQDVRNCRNEIEKCVGEIEVLEKELTEINSYIVTIEKNLSETDKTRQTILEGIQRVEDNIFEDFCLEIGVPNIRVYEEYLQKKTKKLVDKKSLIDKINSCLEYQKQEKTIIEDKIQQLHSSIKQSQKELKNCTEKKNKQSQTVAKHNETFAPMREEETAQINKLKTISKELKELIKKEQELVRKQKEISKDIYEHQQNRNLLKIEFNNTYKDAMINQIKIPLFPRRNRPTVSTDSEEIGETNFYDRVCVDYTLLPDEYEYMPIHTKVQDLSKRDLRLIENLKIQLEQTKQEKENLSKKIPLCLSPERVTELMNERNTLKVELKRNTLELYSLGNRLHKAKKLRIEEMERLRNEIEKHLVDIFLNFSTSYVEASLRFENEQEPYLGGLEFTLLMPNKTFQPLQSLSGGEKSIASTILLLAFQRYLKAPFLVFDEVDVHLDNVYLYLMYKCLKKISDEFPLFIISHNDAIANYTDELIGVTREHFDDEVLRSFIVTLSLK